MNWKQIVNLLTPIVVPILLSKVPHGALLAPIVASAITTAEDMTGQSGAQKLAAAQQITDLGIAGINAAAGTTKIDPVAVHQTLADGISAVVSAANLIHGQQSKAAA